MAQGVEVHQMTRELYVKMLPAQTDLHEMPLGSFLVFVNQPQKNNILSLFEKQVYPHRLMANGEAEVPYDVAGWTLPLQMGVEYDPVWQIRDQAKEHLLLKRVVNIDQARAVMNLGPQGSAFAKQPNPLKTNPRIGLYKGFTGSMDEGWTRFVLDTFQIPFRSVADKDLKDGRLGLDVLILPADNETTLLRGLNAGRYPAELSGGMGDAGVENLKKFVAGGGRLICFDDSCEMVIKRFALPMKNVLSGLKRSEFYNPGSLVLLDVDISSQLSRGLRAETAAYYTTSSAFEEVRVTPSGVRSPGEETAKAVTLTAIARYAAKDTLLSGWMLGEKYLNGKIALAEATYGKGSVVLFGFRPQHRGQSWGTFPFIFNALESR
jgi:hypothetical protein